MKIIFIVNLILLSLILVPPLHAANIPMTGAESALYRSALEIRSQLEKTGKITASEAKNILNNNILVAPDMFTLQSKITIKTGSNGIAEFTIPQKTYRLNVEPIEGYDIAIPSEVYINKSPFIIGIGISQGSGQVRKKSASNGLFASIFGSPVYAQEKTFEVKVVTYHDQNKNGRWDRDEDIIPWAGVELELTDSAAGPGKSFFEKVPFFKIQMGPPGN